MKVRIVILIICTVILITCSKEKHVMWVSIENKTNYTIVCQFYPTKSANGYILSSQLDSSMMQEDIYSSENVNQKPTDLLRIAYDSFIVTIPSLNRTMVFKNDSVMNYRINPYNDLSSWDFEQTTRDFPTNFTRNKTEINNYIFSIKAEDFND